jgi:hypothetical protein
LWQDARQARDLGLNPYGCADAANILYTIGRFPRDPAERQAWIDALQRLQDPASGLFHEPTHHPIHTTAHCIAALELFDAGPRHPVAALLPLAEPQAMAAFLDGLDWRGDPWSQSHQGAGLYVSLVLTGAASLDWQDRYFAWLWDETDPGTGFLRRGCIGLLTAAGTASFFPHLAGTFHYLFNQQYARRPMRYPAALVDACLQLFERNAFPLGRAVGFAEIDWVYCLARAARQGGHRQADARRALEAFAARYVDYLSRLDPQADDSFNDLHALFGAVCALAELQQAVPGMLRTERPLRLVLDRRPFI